MKAASQKVIVRLSGLWIAKHQPGRTPARDGARVFRNEKAALAWIEKWSDCGYGIGSDMSVEFFSATE